MHLLKGVEAGNDIFMLTDHLQRVLGQRPRLITPADLRVVPDSESPLGFKLCCLAAAPTSGHESRDHKRTSGTLLLSNDDEPVEEIHQVALELHQHELHAMSEIMLRLVSLRCLNDMRTILLVHDKRMLGIVRQELPRLVESGVLTASQGAVLQKGIVETILPGSPEMADLLRRCRNNPHLINDYLLKPIRSGKGDGIRFGDEMAADHFLEHIEQRLASPRLDSSLGAHGTGSTWVVQRLVNQRLYSLSAGPSGREWHPLIGTFHLMDGELIGLGIWRYGPGRICAVSTGGHWTVSATPMFSSA